VVAAANLNSPGQTVISGAAGAVERAVELLKEAGAKRAVMLPVSAPFHCALMQPAQDALARDLAQTRIPRREVSVAANVSASFVTTGDAARKTLVAQVPARCAGWSAWSCWCARAQRTLLRSARPRAERTDEADSGQGRERAGAECGGRGRRSRRRWRN